MLGFDGEQDIFLEKGISMSQGLIQGSMREAPLPDIIQLVSQSGKTGCFHVNEDPERAGAGEAKIYLKDGRVIHALSSTCEGLDAVYEVALWLEGHYHFEEGDAAVPQSITKPNPAILMEMHRRLDEWRVISQKIESLDLYPYSLLLPGDTASGVNPRQARLLAMLTGYYTAAELAEVLQKPVLNIAKDLYDLVMAGLAVMKAVRSKRKPEIPGEAERPAEPARASVPPTPMPQAFPEQAPAPAPAPEPVPEAPAPHEVHVPAIHVAVAPPVPVTVPEPLPKSPAAGVVTDPVKMAKLTAFTHRIAKTAKDVLPAEHHDMVNHLQALATQQIIQGDGPEAVKNLALSISKGAVEAGCDAPMVKNLNASLKSLFSK